jgi:transposase
MAKKYEIDDDQREVVYDTDLTNEEWALVKPFLLEQLSVSGAPMSHSLRDTINGCLYITDNGNKWENLPKEYPDHNIVW